jgi:hypothetical protein
LEARRPLFELSEPAVEQCAQRGGDALGAETAKKLASHGVAHANDDEPSRKARGDAG